MRRMVGDTAPINGVSYIDANRTPLDWTTTGYTPKIRIETRDGTATLADTAITAHPTQTVTFDSTAANNWCVCNDHGFSAGDQLVFATSGSLSGTGITAAIRYLVVDADRNWFRVSDRSGGLPVTIAGAGTGAHTVYRVGSWQATNAQASLSALTAQMYRAWVSAFNGSTLIEGSPASREGFPIDVQAFGE